MEVENTPEPKSAEEDFTAHELLQDLSGDDWADTATPPLTSSSRKNLELPLTSETSNMGMIPLSTEESKKNTFEGNKSLFLGTLDEMAWREFLSEFNQKTKSENTLDNFKEELWNTVVKFGEPMLMGTGLDEIARKKLLSKMFKLREKDDESKDRCTLKQKTDDKMIKVKGEDTFKTSNMIESTDNLKLGNKSLEVYQILVQHVAGDNSGLSLARRKDATCFFRWIMSVMTNSTVQACPQKAMGSKTMERRVSTVILIVYQSTGIEREDESRQSLENHGKLDESRRFHNKKIEEGHDVHRNLAMAEAYSRPNKKGEYQYVYRVIGIAYNP